jgi:hypothetical protein
MALIDDIAGDASTGFNDWGTTATFDVSGTPTDVSAIFEAGGVNQDLYDGAVETSRPLLLIQAADITPTHGQAVTVNSVNYIVNGIRLTGYGNTEVDLLEV